MATSISSAARTPTDPTVSPRLMAPEQIRDETDRVYRTIRVGDYSNDAEIGPRFRQGLHDSFEYLTGEGSKVAIDDVQLASNVRGGEWAYRDVLGRSADDVTARASLNVYLTPDSIKLLDQALAEHPECVAYKVPVPTKSKSINHHDSVTLFLSGEPSAALLQALSKIAHDHARKRGDSADDHLLGKQIAWGLRIEHEASRQAVYDLVRTFQELDPPLAAGLVASIKGKDDYIAYDLSVGKVAAVANVFARAGWLLFYDGESGHFVVSNIADFSDSAIATSRNRAPSWGELRATLDPSIPAEAAPILFSAILPPKSGGNPITVDEVAHWLEDNLKAQTEVSVDRLDASLVPRFCNIIASKREADLTPCERFLLDTLAMFPDMMLEWMPQAVDVRTERCRDGRTIKIGGLILQDDGTNRPLSDAELYTAFLEGCALVTCARLDDLTSESRRTPQVQRDFIALKSALLVHGYPFVAIDLSLSPSLSALKQQLETRYPDVRDLNAGAALVYLHAEMEKHRTPIVGNSLNLLLARMRQRGEI